MISDKKETIKNRGCPCGWPIDSCNLKLRDQGSSNHKDCAKVKHEREVSRLASKEGLEARAREHDSEASFYRRAANLIQIQES